MTGREAGRAPPRVHHPEPLAGQAEVTLEAGAGRHLVRVLRLRTGDAVVLFDGLGGEYAGRITSADDARAVRIVIEGHRAIERESGLELTLAQVVARGERMDLIVQKAVELGITRIVPLTSRRCNVRLDAKRAAKRIAHWRGIVIAACEQCGRNRLPEVAPVRALDDWLAEATGPGERLTLAPTAAMGLGEWATTRSGDDPITLLIGPEGGLATDEIANCQTHGFTTIRLGPRTLRTETAGLAAIAALQALCGDMG